MPPIYLQIEEVAKSYGKKSVLSGASISVAGGSLVGIVGENGCGKSTLLQVMVGAARPEQGRIARNGHIGYCPQEAALFEELTVMENFQLFAAGLGKRADHDWRKPALEMMDRLSFRPYQHSLVRQLSGGTRQKLNLSIALLNDPDVLLLDEPYAAFDWQTYLKFWELAAELRRRGKSVLIVSHLLHDQNRFDQLYELRDGRLEKAA